jgi:uncharacterized membrane protein YecN with MAPEG domain
MAPITGLYGALCGLLLIAFSSYVIYNRGRYKVGLGDGGNPALQRAIRIQGNSIEYIPIALILMLLYELYRGYPIILHIAGLCLVLGRIAYAIGLSGSSGTSSGRLFGTLAAFFAIFLPAVGLLIKAAGIY